MHFVADYIGLGQFQVQRFGHFMIQGDSEIVGVLGIRQFPVPRKGEYRRGDLIGHLLRRRKNCSQCAGGDIGLRQAYEGDVRTIAAQQDIADIDTVVNRIIRQGKQDIATSQHFIQGGKQFLGGQNRFGNQRGILIRNVPLQVCQINAGA